jgi:non-ribosomal peptide synthetase component F
MVCIVPEEATKDLQLLHKFIIDNRITGGCFTTQIGQLLLQEYPDLPLDYMVVGGEKMTANPPCSCRLINTYGPTEFCVDATWYELEPGRQYANIPIGRPLHNQTAYIIDRDRRLLPRGMAGELCLAGIQMATGYWKREELTNKLFTDIIVDGKPVKVYRTGDLCRWNEEGQLEYIGRIDQQVKLRGFRIELGEIESLALKLDGIRQAVATVHDGQLLCLYYVTNGKWRMENGELKNS